MKKLIALALSGLMVLSISPLGASVSAEKTYGYTVDLFNKENVPVITPTTTDPVVTPTTTDPVVTPTTTDPVVTPATTDPVVTPTTTDPVVTPTTTDPIVTPITTYPVATPLLMSMPTTAVPAAEDEVYVGADAVVSVSIKDIVEALVSNETVITYDDDSLTFKKYAVKEIAGWIIDVDSRTPGKLILNAAFTGEGNVVTVDDELAFDLIFTVKETGTFTVSVVSSESITVSGVVAYGRLDDYLMKSVCQRGDFDDNRGVDRNDAVYLLYASVFGEEAYPLNQPGDVDGDKSVNRNDAVYLLYHSIFGEEAYPLSVL